ncbi:LAQU0S07e04632g1_1 [Lachancea quebecensis]|uniref:LAQU0S07e04632g1_1 n=1 Tax=Lachancea quebecensis TaxID=1654605 RepID=A0A0P1KTI6_9SACH|nr:LAQU0S07e04632g1_1 [Lachancea quebecensis]
MNVIGTLKLIARVLSCVLVINLITLLLKKPLLPWLHNWLLACPSSTQRCALRWQKWPFVERLVWKFLIYIETNHHL